MHQENTANQQPTKEQLKPQISKKQRKHLCKWCRAAFYYSTDLKRHRLRHTQRDPEQKVAYIPAVEVVMEEEMRKK
ncbi:hypothetical protein HDV64DRAFT_240210 [Trichoderma sp. TUCIM 5745]